VLYFNQRVEQIEGMFEKDFPKPRDYCRKNLEIQYTRRTFKLQAPHFGGHNASNTHSLAY
jgi:hypothetical protein